MHVIVPVDPHIRERLKNVLFEDLPNARSDSQRNEERVRRLSEFTSDAAILEHPDLVAFTQDEVDELVK